ncbi:hypothetical protein KUTeg_017656 [Tegillarca granosa]|uniref:Uncharacterized protein n=1 Tax=Tegillarca granosa TaxID=220873 RepID=A0ABQ9EFJ2_TEGGR|nr:hypothetical protein KUTeg_017656 [Tegillarca granosa]
MQSAINVTDAMFYVSYMFLFYRYQDKREKKMGNESSQNVVYGDSIENDIQVSWSKVQFENPFPTREGQCCCSLGKHLYIFGGVLHGDELVESNELLTFDVDTRTWQKLLCKGSVPSPRSAASLVAIGTKLYLFGGLSHEFGWFNDFYSFDTGHQCPSPRDKLQATVIGDKIFYFGGFGPKAGALGDDEEWEDDEDDEDDEVPNDQEGAEFATNKWSQPIQMNLGVPTARAAHAMCSIGKNIVIFGGRDTEARRNDLHIFNTETRKWDTEMKAKGRQPGPRSFHTATAVGNRVVVMGGRAEDNKHYADLHIFDSGIHFTYYFLLHKETCEWLQPKVTGDLPTGRGQHSVEVVSDTLVLYGEYAVDW